MTNKELQEKLATVYMAANRLLCHLCAEGDIDTRDSGEHGNYTDNLLDSLFQLDGGTFICNRDDFLQEIRDQIDE